MLFHVLSLEAALARDDKAERYANGGTLPKGGMTGLLRKRIERLTDRGLGEELGICIH